jgi:Flp pilus assembly pilin Flp
LRTRSLRQSRTFDWHPPSGVTSKRRFAHVPDPLPNSGREGRADRKSPRLGTGNRNHRSVLDMAKLLSRSLRHLVRQEEAATQAEYALLLLLILVVLIGGVGALGTSIRGLYDSFNQVVP